VAAARGSSGGSRGGDWGGALTVGGSALATAFYNDQIKQRGGDAAGAAVMQALVAGLILGFSQGTGFLANASAGVLGGSVASLLFS